MTLNKGCLHRNLIISLTFWFWIWSWRHVLPNKQTRIRYHSRSFNSFIHSIWWWCCWWQLLGMNESRANHICNASGCTCMFLIIVYHYYNVKFYICNSTYVYIHRYTHSHRYQHLIPIFHMKVHTYKIHTLYKIINKYIRIIGKMRCDCIHVCMHLNMMTCKVAISIMFEMKI